MPQQSTCWQVEKLAGNKALHFLCWSWLECDKLPSNPFGCFDCCVKPCYLCYTSVQIRKENQPQNFKPSLSPMLNY